MARRSARAAENQGRALTRPLSPWDANDPGDDGDGTSGAPDPQKSRTRNARARPSVNT